MANNKIVEMNPSKIGLAKGRARTVLAPKRSLTYQTLDEIREKFEEYLMQRKTEIILDLKTVSFIDSKGLEFLCTMNDKLREQGGCLKIANMNKVCNDIMVCTRLVNIINVYKDIQSAIKG